MTSSYKAFTLVELLVTIAIIAVLAVVVITAINPSQLLAQSRDSNRIADMAALWGAIGFYQADQSAGSMGTSSVISVSVFDPAAVPPTRTTCPTSTMALPTLPNGYSYDCTASSTLRNVSSTGWIPLNFRNISGGSPMGILPIDPVNSTSSRLYYTYTTDGVQFEVTAAMESAKYKLGGSANVTAKDGGILPSIYEKGTLLGLEPVDYSDASLVGYWPMEEGTGSTTADVGGGVNVGTWFGNASGTNNTYYVPGKIGNYAGFFDGTSTYLDVGNSAALNPRNGMTISAWVNFAATPGGNVEDFITRDSSSLGRGYVFRWNGTGSGWYFGVWTAGPQTNVHYMMTPTVGVWYYLVGTFDPSGMNLYLNGANVNSTSTWQVPAATTGDVAIGKDLYTGFPDWVNGSIDDVRIYNRALSAAEVQTLYNAGK